VNDANAVKVIHFKAVNERAVGERGIGAGNLRAIAPDERSLSFSHLLGKRSNDFSQGKVEPKRAQPRESMMQSLMCATTSWGIFL
jgi:hypothetical protein